MVITQHNGNYVAGNKITRLHLEKKYVIFVSRYGILLEVGVLNTFVPAFLVLLTNPRMSFHADE